MAKKETDIQTYILQRPPMVMVGEIRKVEDRGITTTFTVPADNLFCHNGLFREAGLIENMAQSAAARVGYLCKDKNQDVPLGFIGAVKNLKIHALPCAGDTIETHVTVEHEVLNATVVSGKVFCGNRLLAECELNIFLQDENPIAH